MLQTMFVLRQINRKRFQCLFSWGAQHEIYHPIIWYYHPDNNSILLRVLYSAVSLRPNLCWPHGKLFCCHKCLQTASTPVTTILYGIHWPVLARLKTFSAVFRWIRWTKILVMFCTSWRFNFITFSTHHPAFSSIHLIEDTGQWGSTPVGVHLVGSHTKIFLSSSNLHTRRIFIYPIRGKSITGLSQIFSSPLVCSFFETIQTALKNERTWNKH